MYYFIIIVTVIKQTIVFTVYYSSIILFIVVTAIKQKNVFTVCCCILLYDMMNRFAGRSDRHGSDPSRRRLGVVVVGDRGGHGAGLLPRLGQAHALRQHAERPHRLRLQGARGGVEALALHHDGGSIAW